MSENIESISNRFAGNGKEYLKALVGGGFANAFPDRMRKLYRHPERLKESFIDKAIMFHLRKRAVTQKRDRFLQRMHASFWGGDGGSVFASNCENRFIELFLKQQQLEMDKLMEVAARRRPKRIVEIGCNSGLLLQHLTENISSIQEATGIDLNGSQIEANQQAEGFDPRIQFVHDDGMQWLKQNAKSDTLFVTNGGVLEYIRQDLIAATLGHIATKLNNSIFLSIEPIAVDHDFSANSDSIPFGTEHSFSHNYRRLFDAAGFEVLFQRHVDFDKWRMQSTLAID